MDTLPRVDDASPLETVPCAVCHSTAARRALVRPPVDEFLGRLDVDDRRSSWVVCEDCGLVFQSPRPGPAALDRMYVGGEYHEVRGGIPEHYVRYSLRRSTAALAWGLDQPALRGRRGRALDIGAGIGGALVGLRDRGWEVRGVEPDPHLAAFGRRRFGLDITDGFFDERTFAPGEAFDLAYSCHVWEHLADPAATSAAAHRVLAPAGGHLLIVVPTFRRSRTLAWSYFNAAHTYMFTATSLSNVLEGAGFETVAHRYVSGGDSELWLLARAADAAPAGPIAAESARVVQRELASVPLRVPLGLAGRGADHLRTLRRDPRDFAQRTVRSLAYRAERLRGAVGRR
ncbi:MAG: class I SAM-dependent methyltransferase [Acidimicrobiales bacterium]|nr:class I SAM-dependent methyltransferase [Acidimicrobiales bacterium]MCB9372571.1 class I SAM-dependent methyltransferase [Microthrixaceae bacterium]